MAGTTELTWEFDGTSRIPFGVYTSDELHRREMERFFYRRHWCYVGLEVEVPRAGDFVRTAVGERSVIMVRDAAGEINVVENVCAHRGMRFCRERHGTTTGFVCPYHQWRYNLQGELRGVPFRAGVKHGDPDSGGTVHGGMPADFATADHGLTRLRVARRGGVVFASFDHDVEPLEDFLGPTILRYFDRLFDGRELTLLGYNRQRIPGNWKLMQENIKDPYHPGLLHTWFVTFGLWRADNTSQLRMDDHFRHAAMISTRGNAGKTGQATAQVASFKQDMTLHDPSQIDVVPEPWWGGPSVVMTTIFPSVIFQQQVNSVSTRQIQPNGHGSFDFVWTHFGFADDTDEMTARRLRQANLFGPAGYVSADDGEVIEFSQQAFESTDSRAIAEMGGRDVGDTEHMVTETLIRGMYRYWRTVMEAEE
jgi:salicylate 5-hydroxylase large subunit